MQSFNLAEPAFALGFGDAGDQVVADLDQSAAARQRLRETSGVSVDAPHSLCVRD
ncbi:hypothetical protein [Embleya scabrispora]|uniref:hypothetical protein n=1 Tax=Embleya scabrispora TaxID=159449 RepID=UPI001F3655EB|nr:hypothetical protein [Embleya scabrispora]